MKSFPKSEYWHFKISWKHCQENFQFSRRDFFGLQDFDISMRSYLTSCRDSRWGCGRLDFGISRRSYLKSCRDSRRVFGRRDFQISSRSLRESRRVFGRRDFEISPRSRQDLAEISPRSRQSRRPKTRRDSHRDLSQNFAGVMLYKGGKTPKRIINHKGTRMLEDGEDWQNTNEIEKFS